MASNDILGEGYGRQADGSISASVEADASGPDRREGTTGADGIRATAAKAHMDPGQIKDELTRLLKQIDSTAEADEPHGLMERVVLLENVVAALAWAIGRLLDSPRSP
jgi:hypothetical protein